MTGKETVTQLWADVQNCREKVADAAVRWRKDHPLPTHFMSASDSRLAHAVDYLTQAERQIKDLAKDEEVPL
jgi:molybdopterin-guanine dinucleotide biosynthesis protein A